MMVVSGAGSDAATDEPKGPKAICETLIEPLAPERMSFKYPSSILISSNRPSPVVLIQVWLNVPSTVLLAALINDTTVVQVLEPDDGSIPAKVVVKLTFKGEETPEPSAFKPMLPGL